MGWAVLWRTEGDEVEDRMNIPHTRGVQESTRLRFPRHYFFIIG